MQILDHALQDHQLLIILFAEQGRVGLHDIEQLHHYGGDAAKMTGAELAFQDRNLLLGRVDMVGLRKRVHLAFVGSKEVAHAGGDQFFAVGFKRTRIAIEVLARPELQPVYENRRDDRIGMLGGLLHECDMTLVQIAHGGHEGNPPEAAAGGS